MIKLLLHFLLHFGSNSFKIKRHGPIRNPFDKMPPDFKTSWRDLYDEICSIGPNIERIMSPGGYVSCLNRTKNAIERVQTLPTRSHKKSSSKSHPVWLRSGGSKRCHLPVICLGKTRHNPNIIIILMFGFFVVFYRETKWPKRRFFEGSEAPRTSHEAPCWCLGSENGTSAGPLCTYESSQ